ATAHWLNTECCEETSRDLRVRDALRVAGAGEIDVIVTKRRQILEVRALLFPGEILISGDARQSSIAGGFVNRDKLFRIAKRQCFQQHSIDHTEDRSVHTDREHQCDHCNRGEARMTQQATNAMQQVFSHRSYSSY